MGDIRADGTAEVQIGHATVSYYDKGHKYVVTSGGRTWRPPSATTVTKCLDINGKSGRLMGWAVNQTVEQFREDLVGLATPEGEIRMSTALLTSLLDRAKKASSQKTEVAADIGKLTHAECERWVEDGVPGETYGFEVFRSWAEDVKLDREGALAERLVYHPGLDYTGTFDLLAKATIRGARGWWLIDIKTSNALRPEYDLQLAAYAGAIQYRYPHVELEGAICLRLPKSQEDGVMESRGMESEDLVRNFGAFEAARQLFAWSSGR